MKTPRKPVGKVKSRWLSWYPEVGFDARFWVTVARLVKERGVRSNDKSGVVGVCHEVKAIMNRRKYT